MLSTPPLVSVIGPIEAPLLAAWVGHYRLLGIERFLIAFHFPEHVPDQRRHELQAASRELGIIPAATSSGPWHEHTNGELRDAPRQQAGPGWPLLADAAEFQQYPIPLDEMIAQAEHAGHRVVGGLMLDRVTIDGSLTGWDPQTGLAAAYPLGAFLTHQLLGGDPPQDRARALQRRRGLRRPPRRGSPPGQPATGCRPPLQVARRRTAGHRTAGRALGGRHGRPLPRPGSSRPAACSSTFTGTAAGSRSTPRTWASSLSRFRPSPAGGRRRRPGQ
ncbi:hypothetical protein [Streptomyces sp. 049-1]|uniref:hypothetical protein n=1 Tax=Streptomyces sp. 049-1 TaxID=2789264 RepID=UPI00397ED5A9